MLPEALEEKLLGMVYEDALAEQEAAQLLVDHWKNSPHRVLSIAEQQLKAEGSPIQPALLKFRYWGDHAIEFNISRLWDLLWPITFDGIVVRLSLGLLLVWGLDAALDSYEIQSQSNQVQIVQIQE